MSTTLIIDNRKMHSLETALGVVEYSRDHVTKLAREGKIIASRLGRKWYIDLESLKQYELVTDLEQQVKQKHVSEERRLEKEIAARRVALEEKRNSFARDLGRIRAGVLATFVLTIIAGGVMSGVLPQVWDLHTQQALLPKENYRERLATSQLILNLTPDLPETTFADDAVQTEFIAQPGEAIVLLSEEVAEETPFSDEVKVVLDDSGRQRIVPVDENGQPLGDGVPFVTVPLSEVPVI